MKNRLHYILFSVFLAVFLIITFKGLLTAQPGDENVYYYMGRLAAEGKVPHKDFFYAHPPLQVYALSLIYKIFGFNIIALKLLPWASTVATVFFLFKTAKEKFGKAAAIASSAIYLFSYSVMFNSVFSFGTELAAMFLVIGAYFLFNKSSCYTAGFFFGLASVTRLLSLPVILAILAAVFISGRKTFWKLSSAFLAVFIIVNIAFLIVGGNSYFSSVYSYHFIKSYSPGENFREYADIIKLNWILFSAALLFVFAGEKRKANVFAAASVAYLLFLLGLKKLFGFYFLAAFPFLAILGGLGIVGAYNRLANYKKLRAFLTIFASLLFLWNLSSDALFLHKVGYAGFERGDALAEAVELKSNPDTMLFGDDSVVPLLALMTERRIAFDLVDTNSQVFESEIVSMKETLESLKHKDILFIARSAQGISSFGEVRRFLNEECDLLSTFHDKLEGSYLIYKCEAT